MLTYLTGKIKESKILHPIIVIHQFGFVGSIALKVQELGQLLLDASYVVTQSLFCQQITFLRFTGRVADHTGCTTYKSQRLMAATLEMTQHHHTTQVADMQRVSSRVDAQICCNLFFSQ